MSDPIITSIVLSYNSKQLSLQCLATLKNQDYAAHKIIVVDNASTDGSVTAIEENFPDIEIIASEKNLGYAAGNNLGIQTALKNDSEYLFLVNNDTTLPPNCISELVNTFQKRPLAGIVGPMVYTFDPGLIISSAGGKVEWEKANSINQGAGETDTGQHSSRSVDFINGCGLMISRTAIEKVGLLDEKYFMYWEETDWCVRVKHSGLEVFFTTDANMRHKAPIHSESLSPTTIYYMGRNRLRFFGLHTPWPKKPVTILHALHGILLSIQSLKKERKTIHAKAAQKALLHAAIGKWGYTIPTWQ